MNKQFFLSLFVTVVLTVLSTEGKKLQKEEDCEVCVSVIRQFEEEAPKELYDASQAEIIKAFQKFCAKKKGKEERFCYYVGGSEISATNVLGKMTDPFKHHFPPLKICDKLRDKNEHICELKYDKKIDFSTVDFKKLKVKELKKILSDWGEDRACKGCTEKSEFVKVVKELLPKYDPQAAAKLKTEL